MMQTDTERPAAREIIDTLAEALRAGVEPLDEAYNLVPASYQVFLHPDAYQELEAIFPIMLERAAVRLDRELKRLNEGGMLRRVQRLVEPDRPGAQYRRAGRRWHIEIFPTHDAEAEPGYIAVVAELAPPQQAEAAGPKTRRLTLRDTAGGFQTRMLEPEEAAVPAPKAARTTMRTEPAAPERAPAGREETAGHGTAAYARLSFTDDSGARTVLLSDLETAVGRRDEGYDWVEVQLDTLDDVSREHLRLRYDPEARTFRVKDLSSFGTTVAEPDRPETKRTLPPSIDPETGRDLERWEPLPERAVIGLADVVFIHFEALHS
ncbi:MAG: FHA domain-containing protein [Rhodothermales bacterium]|nr:FHA domain-containing protein [Rhodothermales bacterium]